MPVALLVAFLASLGVHGLVLFGADYELSEPAEPPPLVAELKIPKLRPPAPTPPPVAKATPVKHRKTPQKTPHQVPASPLSPLAVPAVEPTAETADSASESAAESAAESVPGKAGAAPPDASPGAPAIVADRLPARGRISYRVDSGDQGFQVGTSIHDWEIANGAYRITAVSETSGVIRLFRPLRIDVESRGRMTGSGLVPEHFVTRRQDGAGGEGADFDWPQRQVRMGARPPQSLDVGAQDLLSFPYQLSLLAHLQSGDGMPIATGKKYANFRLEVLGDQEISVPAGTFRCLHLRVPGVATTELWLAYERAMLPVKVQHVDRKGNILVQVATAIDLGNKE